MLFLLSSSWAALVLALVLLIGHGRLAAAQCDVEYRQFRQCLEVGERLLVRLYRLRTERD